MRYSCSTSVLGEAGGQGAVLDLLLKQIHLVEEQDDGCLCEPFVVADGVEELHALVHPVLGATSANYQEIRDHHQGNMKEMS